MGHRKTFPFSDGRARNNLVAAFALLLALYVFYCLVPFLRAQYVLAKLEKLEVGHSNSEYAYVLAREVDAKAEESCNRFQCAWKLEFDNSRLPRWWRGSGETILASFAVHNSIVVRKSIAYGKGVQSDEFSPSSITVTEKQDWGRIAVAQPIVAGWKTTELYRYYEFVVYATSRAPAEERRRYTAFNLNCLWRYKGCQDARQMLPIAAATPPPPEPE